jgi:hypothetical protein
MLEIITSIIWMFVTNDDNSGKGGTYRGWDW